MIVHRLKKINGVGKMKIFVTGGSGFVGRNLVKRLIDEGHEVTITSTGSEPNIPGVKKVVYMTLTGIDWKQLKGQEAVIHLMANNDTRCQDTAEMMKANLADSMKLFLEASALDCERFIYASSTAVYGGSPAPYIEDETPVEPLNPYGQSKADFDKFFENYRFAFPVIGFRYCNIYGPGEDQKGKRMSMIGQMMRTMMTGGRPKLFKWGEQRRDWVYVDDVVQANMLALESDQSGIYNIGSGTSVTFNDIFQTLNARIQGVAIEPEYIDCPFADQYQNHTECNIEKARRELGYSPSFDLRSGIEAYLNSLPSWKGSSSNLDS